MLVHVHFITEWVFEVSFSPCALVEVVIIAVALLDGLNIVYFVLQCLESLVSYFSDFCCRECDVGLVALYCGD